MNNSSSKKSRQHMFKLAGINKKNKGTDSHAELIQNHINIMEKVLPVIIETCKYGTERRINDEINRTIRHCQNVFGWWGDRRSALLYFEENIELSEMKEKGKYIVEHAIPANASVKKYREGEKLQNLIFNPVALITKDSDTELFRAGLGREGHDFLLPFKRYSKVGIRLKNLFEEEIDCKNFTMEDNFKLIRRVPELKNVLDGLKCG